MRFFTAGHGTRTLEELLEVLRVAEVEVLADVRRFPGSRRHPHFAREALEQSLPAEGIRYIWFGGTLGGRRKTAERSRHPAWRNEAFRAYADHMETPGFRSSIEQLEAMGKSSGPVAVMCAETLWWRCHRRLIADALVLRGHDVTHLIDAKSRRDHQAEASLRRGDDGWPVYDIGVDRTLT